MKNIFNTCHKKNSEQYQQYINSNGKILLPLPVVFAIGATSSIFIAPIASPIELIKTQLQNDQNSRSRHTYSKYKNQFQVLRVLFKNSELTRSFNITLLRFMPAYGTYLASYEAWNRFWDPEGTLGDNDVFSLRGFGQVCCGGGLAGVMSWTISSPIDNIKTRIQSYPLTNQNGIKTERLKIMDVTKYIYTKYGVRGFFRGINAMIIRAFPANMVNFYVYEIVYQLLQNSDY